jgi:hypothetical protein
LIQVCADVANRATLAREVRALEAAGRVHRRARRRLLVLDRDSATGVEAPGVTVVPAYEWLLAAIGDEPSAHIA